MRDGNEHEMMKRKTIQPSKYYKIMSYFEKKIDEESPSHGRIVRHLIECDNEPLFLYIQQELKDGRYMNKHFYGRRNRNKRYKEIAGDHRCSNTQKTIEQLVDETLVPKYFRRDDQGWYSFFDKSGNMVYPCSIADADMMSPSFLQRYRGESVVRREFPVPQLTFREDDNYLRNEDSQRGKRRIIDLRDSMSKRRVVIPSLTQDRHTQDRRYTQDARGHIESSRSTREGIQTGRAYDEYEDGFHGYEDGFDGKEYDDGFDTSIVDDESIVQYPSKQNKSKRRGKRGGKRR